MTAWLLASSWAAQDHALFSRHEEIYGRKFGTALTMDVFTPRTKANGAGIVFVVSEGWYFDHEKIDANLSAYVNPYVAEGFTVFAVCHGRNPKFSLPDYIADVHRSVRYVRHHSARLGVATDRIGITGDSAGAHLSLMMGLASQPGDVSAPDPVDRETSQVQAVVAYFPPTDFLNWGSKGQSMLGNHPKVPLKGAFDFTNFNTETNSFDLVVDQAAREKIAREVSPINHVTSSGAPTLLVHGDADTFIPMQQSQIMASKLKEARVPSELIIMKGGEHDEKLILAQQAKAVGWFTKYLGAQKK